MFHLMKKSIYFYKSTGVSSHSELSVFHFYDDNRFSIIWHNKCNCNMYDIRFS